MGTNLLAYKLRNLSAELRVTAVLLIIVKKQKLEEICF